MTRLELALLSISSARRLGLIGSVLSYILGSVREETESYILGSSPRSEGSEWAGEPHRVWEDLSLRGLPAWLRSQVLMPGSDELNRSLVGKVTWVLGHGSSQSRVTGLLLGKDTKRIKWLHWIKMINYICEEVFIPM